MLCFGRVSLINIFTHIHDVVAAYAAGKPILIVDSERENEGDVAVAADRISAEWITFMAVHARGLICVPMLGERLDVLELPLMVAVRGDMDVPAFTVSVDARHGTSTGISAEDRARTIRALIHPGTQPDDLIRPGHIFPLRYAEGGLLTREGHTEAAVDLAKMGKCYPAAVICEVMNDDGTMARNEQLDAFAARHNLMMVNVIDLIEYRRRVEASLERAPLIETGPMSQPPTAEAEPPKEKRQKALNGTNEVTSGES